jgi:branched-chain amino acid transport system permease protein
MLPASVYATQAVHGLVYGMLLFLVASGLTLVFGMMRILNMAHASFYMLGAYFAYSLCRVTGSFWVALVLAPLFVGLLGGLAERYLLRRMAERGHVTELLLTFGLFYMVGEAVLWIWGSFALQVPAPAVLTGSVPLFGAQYPVYRLFILGFSILVCAGLTYVLLRTRTGIIIRSAVSDSDMVSALGINASLVRQLVFAAGAALAALAGVIAAPFLQAEPTMGAAILVDAFIVVVVGGFGSLAGALVAALLLGQLQSFGILFISDYAMVFPFALMVAVLVIRPRGIFGEAS